MSPLLAKLRDRYAPLLLLAGAAGAAYFLGPNVPHARTVQLELDDAASVTAVDIAWAPASGGEAEQGGSWRFTRGQAPAAITSSVRLPDGRYGLDVSIERGTDREGFHRGITLGDGDRIIVRLR